MNQLTAHSAHQKMKHAHPRALPSLLDVKASKDWTFHSLDPATSFQRLSADTESLPQ